MFILARTETVTLSPFRQPNNFSVCLCISQIILQFRPANPENHQSLFSDFTEDHALFTRFCQSAFEDSMSYASLSFSAARGPKPGKLGPQNYAMSYPFTLESLVMNHGKIPLFTEDLFQ